MKIIHCADIHLGSKLESKFSKDKAEERKREVLNTFNLMIEYAKDNDVKIILFSGDVFDKDRPSTKDKDFFYKAIKKNPDIDFLYLNGNHDKEGSYIEYDITNLKTFNKDNFTTYSYDDLDITGIEMDSSNAKAFYSKLSLNKDKLNILMLHGDVSDSLGMDKVKIDNLKNKGIDYLALGHIHSFKNGKIDERGVYAFSGCLEGRGFDECGEKGFILLNVTDKIQYEFIPFAYRTLHEVNVDVTGANDLYDIEEKAKNALISINKKDIVLVNLIGELNVNVEANEKDVTTYLSTMFYFAYVKNKTVVKIDLKDYENDKSLIGEFVRGIYSNETYSKDEKQKLITLGLRVINGREVE